MKKIIAILMALLMLVGCSGESSSFGLYTQDESTVIVEAENADTDMNATITFTLGENEELYVTSNIEEGIISLKFYEGAFDSIDDINVDEINSVDVANGEEYVVYLYAGEFTMVAGVAEKANGSLKIELVQGEEDGQNPVMNYVGRYAYERAAIEVSALDEDQAQFSIVWGNTAAEVVEWTMSGVFNPDTLTVDYSNGEKKTVTYSETGEVASEEVEYTDGTGTFTFTDDLKLTWTDNNENIADGTEFEYIG